MDWVTIVALVLVPVAAAVWSRLIGVETVFDGVRRWLQRRGPVGLWLYSGFTCRLCATVQGALVLVAGLLTGGPVGVVAQGLTFGLAAAAAGVVARHWFDVTLQRAAYREQVLVQATELEYGPRLQIIQTRTTADGVEIAVAPLSTADELALPASIVNVELLDPQGMIRDGWEPYTLDPDMFEG